MPREKKGTERKEYRYKQMIALREVPEAKPYLKQGVTFKQLGAIAASISDNKAATILNKARQRFFVALFAALKK